MRDTRRTRIVLVVLLVLSFTLITLDMRGGDSGPVASLRSFVGSVFGPVQRAVSAVVTPVGEFFSGLGEDERARLEELERENADLRLQLRSSEYAQSRAEELDKLLRTAGLGQYPIVPARVIALGPAQGFAWTATIDAGTRDGIALSQTVINGDGLVGRVKTVTASTATVLLAIDPTFSVGARLAGTLELGIASGQGQDPMELQVLDPQSPLAAGDRAVTRASETFVPGVPIGEVVTVQGTPGSLVRIATLDPFVAFTALDLVGVVVEQPRTDPRDAVLPPRPSASPSPSPSATPGSTPSGTPSASPSGG